MLKIDWKTLFLSLVILVILTEGLGIAIQLVGFCSLVGQQINEYGVRCISIAQDASSITLIGFVIWIVSFFSPGIIGYFVGSLIYFRKNATSKISDAISVLVVFGILGLIAELLLSYGEHLLNGQPILNPPANTSLALVIIGYVFGSAVICLVEIFFSLCGGLLAYQISKPKISLPQIGKPNAPQK